jgi:hypothetical protein
MDPQGMVISAPPIDFGAVRGVYEAKYEQANDDWR